MFFLSINFQMLFSLTAAAGTSVSVQRWNRVRLGCVHVQSRLVPPIRRPLLPHPKRVSDNDPNILNSSICSSIWYILILPSGHVAAPRKLRVCTQVGCFPERTRQLSSTSAWLTQQGTLNVAACWRCQVTLQSRENLPCETRKLFKGWLIMFCWT